MTFGSKLAELRALKKVSQSMLSEMTGIPIGTIRYHEYGKREMTAVALLKYAEALKVSLVRFSECKAIKR